MYNLRFRQVHLDFHTSPAIPAIGAAFDKRQWQEALKRGHVNSITTFAKCHHGWSYHPTKVGKMHPHLDFDLLRAQYDAAKEIGVNVPIYISAGFDELAIDEHADWQEHYETGAYRNPLAVGWHKLCFNGPYLDYLCEQIEETVSLFPECDGIFLDIISQGSCLCPHCIRWMTDHDLDAREETDRRICADQAIDAYYEKTTAACKSGRDDMPVFHNSGHIQRGNTKLYTDYFSHLELESLPTGGWGYDHFPLSAKYCAKLPFDFLGMTGKFHTTWGEFGGYKHPNALRYECAAMLAYGSKCSIGDQLHQSGVMDPSTYGLIGAAYAEVEAKEPWCDATVNVADVGLLSSAAIHHNSINRDSGDAPDVGAARILLEGHALFDVLDAEMDFTGYRLLILPDDVAVDDALKKKLDAYLNGGGKMLLTGTSGFSPAPGSDSEGVSSGNASGVPRFDLGADWSGESEFSPDFILPDAALRCDWLDQPLVMYLKSQRIKPTAGRSLGDVYDPYFNRDYRQFCGHQHFPPKPEPSGFASGVVHGPIAYLAHPIFSLYRGLGAVAYKDYALAVIRSMLDGPTVETSLPSTARIALREQPTENRSVLHLLYANTISRGGELKLSGGTFNGTAPRIEVIEDLLPLHDVAVNLRPGKPIAAVTLQPSGEPIDFQTDGDTIQFTVPKLVCHQMVELKWA